MQLVYPHFTIHADADGVLPFYHTCRWCTPALPHTQMVYPHFITHADGVPQLYHTHRRCLLPSFCYACRPFWLPISRTHTAICTSTNAQSKTDNPLIDCPYPAGISRTRRHLHLHSCAQCKTDNQLIDCPNPAGMSRTRRHLHLHSCTQCKTDSSLIDCPDPAGVL
jgi:hypothetical protein